MLILAGHCGRTAAGRGFSRPFRVAIIPPIMAVAGGDVCGWLAKPIPMALVTLGASLALPRDSARLPVVVNLAAALLLGMALERLPGARGFALLRPDSGKRPKPCPTVCFYGFLLWGGMPVLRPPARCA